MNTSELPETRSGDGNSQTSTRPEDGFDISQTGAVDPAPIGKKDLGSIFARSSSPSNTITASDAMSGAKICLDKDTLGE